MVLQQRNRHHHHTVQAIPALGSLGVLEGLLHWVQLCIFHGVQMTLRIRQALQGRDVAPCNSRSRNHTGPSGNTINQDGARATLTQATAVFGAIQAQIVAQHLEQCGL